MEKPKWSKEEIPPDALPGEYGPITWEELQALPEEAKRRRGKRALARLQALRGTIHLNIDIDELRGRNR
jgi:hypothetical protein